MVKQIVIFVRHGDYEQQQDTPSAHQPHPLNARGWKQACEGAVEINSLLAEKSWQLHPVIHCSSLLRAYQTATTMLDTLDGEFQLRQTPLLAERSVGCAANLTIKQIEAVVKADPRLTALPDGWKSDSHFCLPFIGAESLVQAGERVAGYVLEALKDAKKMADTTSIAHLFVGHGAAIRHAAYKLGVLPFNDLAKLSMFHARPVCLERGTDGAWRYVAGEWKQRRSASMD